MEKEKDPDLCLVHEIQKGNEAAFDQLYERYIQRIFHFVHIQVKDYQLTEEITQDVFIKMAKGLPKFRAESSFQTWLYTLARNTLTDAMRVQARRRGKEVQAPEELMAAVPDSSRGVEEEVTSRQDYQTLLGIVERLPEDYRTVILLRMFESLSLQETAEVMNRTVASVKTLQFRATGLLRQMMEGVAQ